MNNMNFNTLSININDVRPGRGGRALVKKLKQHSCIRAVRFNGNISDPAVIKIILSAIKGTQVRCLHLGDNLICSDGAKYLAEGLKDTKITHLVLDNNALHSTALEYLPDILKSCTCITDFIVSVFENRESFFKYLAKGLKNSTILNLRVQHTISKIDLLKYLVDVLPETSITRITLNRFVAVSELRFFAELLEVDEDIYISLEEAECLAKLLKNSCITHFELDFSAIKGNVLKILGRALADTNTQIIKFPFFFGSSSQLNKVTSKNKMVANKIQNAFQTFVIEKNENNNLEFIVPNETDNIDIVAYLDFIKTVTKNPNVKGHIFDLIQSSGLTSSNKIRKINEFVKTISDKFNAFFNNELINLLGDFDYIDLVKKCEDMGLHDIVKNLLLHRHLYYVDDGQEILHPFIYKMLNKYEMTLYMEQIEPQKKNEIKAYYESHPEIDGAQEIAELLESQHL